MTTPAALAFIGDETAAHAALGFAAFGIPVIPAYDAVTCTDALTRLRQQGCAIVFITETCYELIAETAPAAPPILTILPAPTGSEALAATSTNTSATAADGTNPTADSAGSTSKSVPSAAQRRMQTLIAEALGTSTLIPSTVHKELS